MFEKKDFNQLIDDLLDAVPKGLCECKEDLEKNFRAILQSALSKLDLVTREEFEIQAKVLERTRKKVDAIEKMLKAAKKTK